MNTLNEILLTALNFEFIVTDAYAYFVLSVGLSVGLMVIAANALKK